MDAPYMSLTEKIAKAILEKYVLCVPSYGYDYEREENEREELEKIIKKELEKALG